MRATLEDAIDRATVRRPSHGTKAEAFELDYAVLWEELLVLLNEVVSTVGLKKVAADLDTSPSTLKHCLAERERHYVRAEWLLYLIDKAPNDKIVKLLARLRGLDTKPIEPLTPEQRVAKLEARLRRMGQDGERLIQEAYE